MNCVLSSKSYIPGRDLERRAELTSLRLRLSSIRLISSLTPQGPGQSTCELQTRSILCRLSKKTSSLELQRGGKRERSQKIQQPALISSSYYILQLRSEPYRVGSHNSGVLQLNMDSVHVKQLAVLLLCLSSVVLGQVPSSTKPAYFVFGDSLEDPGNNNYLPASLAKANFPYNGMDFPGGQATGRFCNGRTVSDVICDLMGIPFPPPYLAPTTKAGQGILQGVNYASAAGGILDATGANFGQRVGMNGQIQYFGNTVTQLQAQIGIEQTNTLLATALCTIVVGSNDFINNYLLADSTTRFQYDTRQYNELLLNTFNQQLTTLYNLGIRKFTVSNVGPLGCIPDQLAIAGTPTCVQSTNAQVQDYNVGLASLLTQLSSNLPESTFLYANVYDSVSSFITNPANYGFTSTLSCCGSGLFNAQFPCVPTSSLCQDRTQYIFWDAYHPTEAANVILANNLWNGGTSYISPMNIQQLLNV